MKKKWFIRRWLICNLCGDMWHNDNQTDDFDCPSCGKIGCCFVLEEERIKEGELIEVV